MKKVLLLFFIAITIFQTTKIKAQVNVQDSLALVDLYNNTGGPNWTITWDLSSPVSTWNGITITGDRVTSISISSGTGNNLKGSIPVSIGNLTSLTNLVIEASSLTGNIPQSLGNLINLQGLWLDDNQLTGSIPSTFANLTNLLYLKLEGNNLSDTIPSFIGQLLNLKYLDLADNKLTGKIPPSLGQLTNLTQFELNNNFLTGFIPQSLGRLINLKYFELEANQLSGNIPDSLGSFNFITYFDLSQNTLTGSIPSNLAGTYPNFVNLGHNQLTGSIPSSLSLSAGYFYVNSNKLSGDLPFANRYTSSTMRLQLDSNEFTFDGMEYVAQHFEQSSTYPLTYAPQANIPIHYNGNVISTYAGGTLANDTFHWYLNNMPYKAVVGDSTLQVSEIGNYSVQVTNSIVTNPLYSWSNLVLYSDTVTLSGDTLIVVDKPKTYFANREYTDTSGWTNYYYDNNTPNDFTDDALLLSLYKNGQDIGTIDDGTFNVKLAETANAGSGVGLQITNPLVTNPTGFYVMNRYWQVSPTTEPTANIGVRFYYNNADLTDLNGTYPSHNLTNNNLIFYKGVGGNPNPTTNLVGATAIISILPSTYASDTTWTYHQLTDTTQYAEFSVASFSGGGGGGTGNDQALPIKLLNFTATKNGNGNLLNWSTSNEINSSFFSIERSNDDVNFSSIGKVSASGFSNSNKAYSFNDLKPNKGANYYRLRMVDKNNNFSYSNVRLINNTASFAALIYPNPVADNLSISFNSDKAMNMQIQIINVDGKIVAAKQVSLAAGSSMQSFNTAGFSNGNYFVKCITDDGVSKLKFMKE